MAIGCFVDKNHQPGEAELAAALGPKLVLWDRFIQFMADSYQLPAELSYGGKNYGWNLWYRKSGKSLASFYPQQDGIVAQVVLGREQVEKALTSDLGERVMKLVRETPQLHDGKWLFIPVMDAVDAADVGKLILLKRRPNPRSLA